jgi:hypothetical protein
MHDQQEQTFDEGEQTDAQIKRGIEHIAATISSLTANDLRRAYSSARRFLSTPVGGILVLSAATAMVALVIRRHSVKHPKPQPSQVAAPPSQSPVDKLLEHIEHGQGSIVDAVPHATLATIISHALGYSAEVTAASLLRLSEREIDAVARWAVLAQLADVHDGHDSPTYFRDYEKYIIHGSTNPDLRSAIDKLTRRAGKDARARDRLMTLAHLVIEHGQEHVSMAQQAELVQHLACGSGLVTTSVTPAMLLRIDKEQRAAIVRLAAYTRMVVAGLNADHLHEYRRLADSVDVLLNMLDRASILPSDDGSHLGTRTPDEREDER